ncbi:hypothetical protein Godav_017964, partial [Gossypium davidsonii]|nr:hypothetical protein [Gossypium davidsonii]
MLRLRSRGTSFLGSVDVPNLKRKALNSWAAVQDTYFSTKDTFERHKVVFTVGTSIASVATAWFDFNKLVDPGHSRAAAWVATAGTALIV